MFVPSLISECFWVLHGTKASVNPVSMAAYSSEGYRGEPIQMNESEFTQYVASIQSASVRLKYMDVLDLCEAAGYVDLTDEFEFTEEMKRRAVQRSKTLAAIGLAPRDKATTDSQVSSTHISEESSEEVVLPQDLESAKASVIDSRVIEGVSPAKKLSSYRSQNPKHGSDSDSDDINASVDIFNSCDSLKHDWPLQDPLRDSLLLDYECENRAQHADSIDDNVTLIETLDELEQDSAANVVAFSAAIDGQAEDVQARRTLPPAAPVPVGEILSSGTSQQFFSATSGTFDGREKSSGRVTHASAGSIRARVGSGE